MPSGEAVARVLRAHILVKSAFMSKIICMIVEKGELDVSGLVKMYKGLMVDDRGASN